MKKSELKAKLSDGRFYYRCTLRNLSDSGFTAYGLPMHFDDHGLPEISLILSPNLTIKVSLECCSATVMANDGKKEIEFRISDPPILWKKFVEKA